MTHPLLSLVPNRCAKTGRRPERRSPAALALRAWAALLTILLLAGNVAADTPAAPNYAGGDGSQNNPFQIATLAQLRKFMESPPFGGGGNGSYFILTATIDAADTSTWLGGLGWQPVGITGLQSFDGQGYQIQNL